MNRTCPEYVSCSPTARRLRQVARSAARPWSTTPPTSPWSWWEWVCTPTVRGSRPSRPALTATTWSTPTATRRSRTAWWRPSSISPVQVCAPCPGHVSQQMLRQIVDVTKCYKIGDTITICCKICCETGSWTRISVSRFICLSLFPNLKS